MAKRERTAKKCEWCSVAVHDGERSALVPGCHRWCVISIFSGDAPPDIGGKAIARKIKRAAARMLRSDVTRLRNGTAGE